jgi:hypothetical protein
MLLKGFRSRVGRVWTSTLTLAVLFVSVLADHPRVESGNSAGVAYRQYVAASHEVADAYICHPRIDQVDCDAAVFVYEFVLTHNWAAPRGYAGGKEFVDKNGDLPPGGEYKEYDIYPKPPPNSGGRDAKRVVIDKVSQSMFYTDDHFATFIRLTYT